LFGEYRNIALDFDPVTLQVRSDKLEAYGIAEMALGHDFYGQIIDTLRRFCIFAYDWRQDNVEAARGLDRLIEAIRRDYANPSLRVDIVAHSMGGLIARYYLRYGTVDVLDGSEQQVTLYGTTRVRKLVLLGTPNMGSASSLHAFLIGE